MLFFSVDNICHDRVLITESNTNNTFGLLNPDIYGYYIKHGYYFGNCFCCFLKKQNFLLSWKVFQRHQEFRLLGTHYGQGFKRFTRTSERSMVNRMNGR